MAQPSLSYADPVPRHARTESLIQGAGEMADLLRTHPWHNTPLGPIEQWSETLLTVVNLMLSSPIPTCLAWGAEMINLYNDNFRGILDARHPSALGMPLHLVWPESWKFIGPQFASVMALGNSISEENVLIPVHSGGGLQDFFWNYQLIPVYEQGRIAGVLNPSQDVTGTVLATRLLTESDERLGIALLAGNCVGTWQWNVKDDIVSGDEQFALYYGADPYVAQTGAPTAAFTSRIHPDDIDRVAAAVESSIRGRQEYAAEYRLLRDDGTILWILARGRCLYNEDGTPSVLRGVSIDISARKGTEEALIRSERLVAAGKLAATIAHELNNPLESVTNLLYLARITNDPAELQEYLALAEREVHRASVISRRTLLVHRNASATPTSVDCNLLVRTILAEVADRTRPLHIEAVAQCRARPLLICHDPEIRQALHHLTVNAIDAMQLGGGRLLLRTRDAINWKTGRRGIAFTIADTGTGLSAQARAEMFDPFFSTKGHGGTGLGLWITKESVERHGGTIHIRSRSRNSDRSDRHGTIISIFLPHPTT